MYTKPINQTLKEVFQEIYVTANEKATIEFDQLMEELTPLDHFQQLEKLINLYQRLEEESAKSEFSFYITNHSSESWLLNQFSNRHYLLNVDETVELAHAVYSGKLARLVREKKYALKEEIPKYSYKQFINGEVCPYFASFLNYYNVSSKDYYKIRTWQTTNLIAIVTYESEYLIRQIQAHCLTLSDPLKFIAEERAIIENFINQPMESSSELIKALEKLFIFRKLDCSAFDGAALLQAQKNYYDSVIFYARLFPAFLELPISKTREKYEGIVSNEATIFETLSKIKVWLDLVIAGQSVQKPLISPNWNRLYNALMKRAEEAYEALIQPLEEQAYHSGLPKKKIRKLLIEELEIYRNRFNKFEAKSILHMLRDENKHLLKQMFITNSFFANNISDQEESIMEAMVIHNLCWNIVQIYADIFDTHRLRYPDTDIDYTEIMNLVNQMVINKEIHEEMRNSMDNFFQHTHAYFLPIELHFLNQFEVLRNVYRKGIDRLANLLDEAEPNSKILYLQSRLKETRQRILQMKELEESKIIGKKEATYLKRFEEFLLIEAEFIHQTRGIELNTHLLSDAPKAKALLAATDLITAEKMDFAIQMMEHLSVTENGKSVLNEKSKSALRGISEALLEANVLPPMGLEKLYRLIAQKIGMPVVSKLDHSNVSLKYKKASEKYIKDHYSPKQVLSGRRDTAG